MFSCKRLLFIVIYSSLILVYITAGPRDWEKEKEKAQKLYNSRRYDEAIILFREIILSSNNETLRNESYFWLAKAYMGINKLKQAEINLEYYLTNFKTTGLNYPEAYYQKGRLLFLQEEYEAAILQLDTFIKQYSTHALISNAYYWIGESLYALGRFEDSEFMFTIVINKYPLSIKKEASTYKLRLIEHKKSELALQNLLKWSQEQYLSALNQFKIKEKMLNEALEKYRTKDDEGALIDNHEYKRLLDENDKLKLKIAKLEDIVGTQEVSTEEVGDISEKLLQLELKEELLTNKEEALKILEEELRRKEATLEK